MESTLPFGPMVAGGQVKAAQVKATLPGETRYQQKMVPHCNAVVTL